MQAVRRFYTFPLCFLGPPLDSSTQKRKCIPALNDGGPASFFLNSFPPPSNCYSRVYSRKETIDRLSASFFVSLPSFFPHLPKSRPNPFSFPVHSRRRCWYPIVQKQFNVRSSFSSEEERNGRLPFFPILLCCDVLFGPD